MQNQSLPKCFNHPESDATSICHFCQRHICHDCLAESNNYMRCKDDFDCLNYQVMEGKYKPNSVRAKEENFDRQAPQLVTDETFSYLVERIKRFSDLQENWDGKNALPVTTSAITRAIRFLHILRRRCFFSQREILKDTVSDKVPGFKYGKLSVEPKDTGGILFEWRQIDFSVEVPPEENSSLFCEYTDDDLDYGGYENKNESTNNYNKLADMLRLKSESIVTI